MLVLHHDQRLLMEEAAMNSAVARLCDRLRNQFPNEAAELGSRFDQSVGEAVTFARRCGFVSQADVSTFATLAVVTHPGFEQSKEFRSFLNVSSNPRDRTMAAFVEKAHPLFWQRFGRPARKLAAEPL